MSTCFVGHGAARVPRRSPGLALLLLVAAALSGACGGESPPADQSDTPDAGDAAPPPDGGATPADAGADAADPELGPPVACGAELPGPPLEADLVEAQPGYAEVLAAVDLGTLPEPFDFSGETPFAQGLLRFMLGRPGTTVSHEDALAAGGLGKAVLAAAAMGQDGQVDLQFLRQGLYYHYACSRPLPGTLGELRSRYGDYETWPKREIACSRPKDGPRTLHENRDVGIYVAETLAGGRVRETEVLFTNLRADGQLDFAVYTSDGELSDRSSFATRGGGTITSAAPFTCMACHVAVEAETYSNITPFGAGAGCE